DSRRVRRREQERSRPMIEKLNERPASGDITTECANRLGKRADLNVHPAVDLEMIDRAAAVLAKYTAGVCVVNHHDAAEFFGKRAEPRQGAQITVHAEDAVRDEQLPLA